MNLQFLAAISKYGIAGAIGLFLSWQLSQRLPVIEAGVNEVKAGIGAIEGQHEVISEKFGEWNQAQGKMNESLLKLMRGQCLNMAEGKTEVQNCNL